MKEIVVYMHESKENMRYQGEELGLSGKALNEKTGKTKIVAVDDRRLP